MHSHQLQHWGLVSTAGEHTEQSQAGPGLRALLSIQPHTQGILNRILKIPCIWINNS